MRNEKTFAAIQARLARVQSPTSAIEFHAADGWFLFTGMETRAREVYEWHGLERSGDSTRPHLIFQITLAGQGALQCDETHYDLREGDALAVLVPSSHRYYLPAAAHWTFFWLTFQHPYVVARLQQLLAASGPVLHIAPHTRLMARSIALWEEQFVGSDALIREQMLFDWMFECERFLRGQLYPEEARDRWLEEVRQRIEQNPRSALNVSTLAHSHGLSRSHYSHQFKAATGLSPAAWIAHVRLDEVARRLVRSDAKLETIARETGLGNASHLNKVFRRRFGLSPGEFRKQMG